MFFSTWFENPYHATMEENPLKCEQLLTTFGIYTYIVVYGIVFGTSKALQFLVNFWMERFIRLYIYIYLYIYICLYIYVFRRAIFLLPLGKHKWRNWSIILFLIMAMDINVGFYLIQGLPHLQTQLEDGYRLTFSSNSFSYFTFPGTPYRIFLRFLPWLPCLFYLGVSEQQ